MHEYMHVYAHVCVHESMHVYAHVCVCVCGHLHCMNETATLWNLTLFIYNFYTWLTVMVCLFLNALSEWSITQTNSSVHLNVTGK